MKRGKIVVVKNRIELFRGNSENYFMDNDKSCYKII